MGLLLKYIGIDLYMYENLMKLLKYELVIFYDKNLNRIGIGYGLDGLIKCDYILLGISM